MRNLQNEVQQFCEKNGLDCSLENRLLDLLSELGEVAKEVLKGTQYGKKPAALPVSFSEELGDLQFSLMAVANQSGVDLESATRNALEKYQGRIDVKGHAGSA